MYLLTILICEYDHCDLSAVLINLLYAVSDIIVADEAKHFAVQLYTTPVSCS